MSRGKSRRMKAERNRSHDPIWRNFTKFRQWYFPRSSEKWNDPDAHRSYHEAMESRVRIKFSKEAAQKRTKLESTTTNP